MEREPITLTNKELLLDLNRKLITIIRSNESEGKKVTALLSKYPSGYKLPKLLRPEVERYIVEHNEYLLQYGDIGDIDKTEVSGLRKIL